MYRLGMIAWFKEVLRDYKKKSIMKRFSQFSRFKGDTRVNEFREVGLYIKSIQSFSYKGDCLVKVLTKLDCIRIEDGWQIGQHLLFKNDKAQYPILYCYNERSSNDWSFIENYYKNCLYNAYDIRIENNPYSIYHHIRVTPSEMGAWQVYLLEAFPFIYHHTKIGSEKEEGIIFSYADIRLINKKFHLSIRDKYDFRPYVWMKNNVAYVSSCGWTKTGGLVREIVTIYFDGDRVKDIINNYELVDHYNDYRIKCFCR